MPANDDYKDSRSLTNGVQRKRGEDFRECEEESDHRGPGLHGCLRRS